jgi:hypothetical protein
MSLNNASIPSPAPSPASQLSLPSPSSVGVGNGNHSAATPTPTPTSTASSLSHTNNGVVRLHHDTSVLSSPQRKAQQQQQPVIPPLPVTTLNNTSTMPTTTATPSMVANGSHVNDEELHPAPPPLDYDDELHAIAPIPNGGDGGGNGNGNGDVSTVANDDDDDSDEDDDDDDEGRIPLSHGIGMGHVHGNGGNETSRGIRRAIMEEVQSYSPKAQERVGLPLSMPTVFLDPRPSDDVTTNNPTIIDVAASPPMSMNQLASSTAPSNGSNGAATVGLVTELAPTIESKGRAAAYAAIEDRKRVNSVHSRHGSYGGTGGSGSSGGTPGPNGLVSGYASTVGTGGDSGSGSTIGLSFIDTSIPIGRNNNSRGGSGGSGSGSATERARTTAAWPSSMPPMIEMIHDPNHVPTSNTDPPMTPLAASDDPLSNNNNNNNNNKRGGVSGWLVGGLKSRIRDRALRHSVHTLNTSQDLKCRQFVIHTISIKFYFRGHVLVGWCDVNRACSGNPSDSNIISGSMHRLYSNGNP